MALFKLVKNWPLSELAGEGPALSGPSIADLQGKNVRSVEDLEADIKQMIGLETDRPRVRPQDEEAQMFQQQLRSLQKQQHLQHAKKIEMSPFEKFVSRVCSLRQKLCTTKSLGYFFST